MAGAIAVERGQLVADGLQVSLVGRVDGKVAPRPEDKVAKAVEGDEQTGGIVGGGVIHFGAALVGHKRGDERFQPGRLALRCRPWSAKGGVAWLWTGAVAAPGESVVAVKIDAKVRAFARRPDEAVVYAGDEVVQASVLALIEWQAAILRPLAQLH